MVDEIETAAASVVRLVIVDDHEVLLHSLASSLDSRPGLAVVASMTSLAAFEARAPTGPAFDVVVVDYDLNDGRGVELVPSARELGAVVLVLSGGDESIVARAAVRSGCAGFVHKGSPLHELERAIHLVHGGGTVFSQSALAAITKVAPLAPALTDRELDVLRLLGTGRSAAQIAKTLFVSIHTTRTHIRAILVKLDASSQLEAVVKAVRSGIILIGDDPDHV